MGGRFWEGVATQGYQKSVHLGLGASLARQLLSQSVPPPTAAPEGGI